MITKSLISFLFSFIFLHTGSFAQQGKGTLTVHVDGLKNDNGLVEVSIYSSDSGFPVDTGKALKNEFSKINDRQAEINFRDLEFGSYAISVYHDENGNRKLDTNWLGIPKEGVGASNNAKGRFGPPKFRDAEFYFGKPEETITIRITYL